MQLALATAGPERKGGWRLPSSLPPFNRLTYRIFTMVWMLAFALALIGTAAGFYVRYTEPENNSQLLLGSRAGFAVSPADATLVRFTVGPQAEKAGIVAGDKIVSIYGLPMPDKMPVDEATLAKHANDPAYITLGNLLYGSDEAEVPLTVRDPDGQCAGRHRQDRRRPYRRRRSKAWHLAQAAGLHRPVARPCFPIPSLGGLATAPPQRARCRQLDPVACGLVHNRSRTALGDLPCAFRRAAKFERRNL